MEVEQNISDALAPSENMHQKKEAENINSSEDEGIFVSHNPHVSNSSDGDNNPESALTSDVNRVGGSPLEVLNGVSEPRMVVLDDDSDEDNVNKSFSFGRRKIAVVSDDEDSSEPQAPLISKLPVDSDDEDIDDNVESCRKKRIIQNTNSDSEDDDSLMFLKRDATQESSKVTKPFYKYSGDLFDTELSDEDQPPRKYEDSCSPVKPRGSDDEDDGRKSDKKKKKVGKQRPSMQKKQQQQQQQLTEIHSETQRMVRESQVSLPYHRPKQRTLAEFLNRRKKTTLPQNLKQSSLKMSMRNMEALRLLEEKKKEVEDFYKSDSDQEDPDDKDWTPESETKTQQSARDEMDQDIKSEVDKIAGKLTECLSDKNEDELPDISQVIGSSSSFNMMNEHSCVGESALCESDSTSAPATEKSGMDKEGPSLASCGDKNDESGIHSGVSSPAEHSQLRGTVADDDNTVPSAPVVNDHFEKESLGSDECKSIVQNDKNVIASIEVDDCNDAEVLPLAAGDLGLLSKASVEGDASKIDMSKVKMSESEVTKTDISEMTLLGGEVCKTDSPRLNISENEFKKTDTPKMNFLEGEVKKADTPKLNFLASKLPDLDINRIITTTPKLQPGKDDDFIDLEEETTTPKMMSGVSELMDRFVRHSGTKRKPVEKHQVNLSVVSKEKDGNGGEKLVSSSVIVTLDAEEDVPTETVPGARFVSLKNALQAKIREQREQERLRRVKEKQFLETEQVIQDYHDDGGLPDEEEELTDQSDTEYETESEPEENDIIIKDKKRKKSAYFDDEAEEDEVEDDEDMVQSEENDNDDGDDRSSETEDNDSNDTIEMPHTQKKVIVSEDNEEGADNEQLKLQWEESQDIHSVAQADSLREPSLTRSNTDDMFASQISRKADNVDKDASITSMDSSFELFGSVIPGHQPGGGMRNNTGGRPSESDGDTAFLTPFTKIKSGSFSSAGRERDLSLPVEDSQDSYNVAPASTSSSMSPCGLTLHLTQLDDSQFPLEKSEKEINPMAKLRLDFTDIGNSQEKDDLIGLCSGQFTGNSQSSPANNLYEGSNISPTQDINELMDLCSGEFASPRKGKRSQMQKVPGNVADLMTSQSNLDGSHNTDDDELLNLCTAKFTTQEIQENSVSATDETEKPVNKPEDVEEEETRPVPKMIVYSSDEENGINRNARVKIRKKRKRIMQFSDDEDAQDAIEYDDEENEIRRTTFTGFKDKMKGGIRADFLENEAELSGSDAVTEDEDEDGEDAMEEEEGDFEQYDENELRNQVGRAHLKNVLDSDKREIRLLQEMYLEDGELHGEGRQRQFRWKNVGEDTEDNDRKVLSDEEGVEEDMEDVEWRMQRIEREKFLQEQKAKVEDNEPEFFKLSCRPTVRSTSLVVDPAANREPLKEANSVPVKNPKTTKNPFCKPSKRGSFLSRDRNTLARIAELTKDKGSVVGGAKQAGNFIFQQLSAEEVQEKVESTKLNRSHSLPNSKRPKLDRSFFSMDASSQSSSIFKYL